MSKRKPSIEEQLAQFIEKSGWPNREWIGNRYLKVYIRRAKRLVNREMVDTLDLSSVEVQEKHQRKGHWTNFLIHAESLVEKHDTIHYVFIENVINPHLAASLLKRGYTHHGEGSLIKRF